MQIKWSLKSIQTLLLKKNNRGRKSDKKIDWKTSFKKIFYILQNHIEVFKKNKLTQSINQSTIAADSRAN